MRRSQIWTRPSSLIRVERCYMRGASCMQPCRTIRRLKTDPGDTIDPGFILAYHARGQSTAPRKTYQAIADFSRRLACSRTCELSAARCGLCGIGDPVLAIQTCRISSADTEARTAGCRRNHHDLQGNADPAPGGATQLTMPWPRSVQITMQAWGRLGDRSCSRTARGQSGDGDGVRRPGLLTMSPAKGICRAPVARIAVDESRSSNGTSTSVMTDRSATS